MATFNRGKLKRLVMARRVVMVSSLHYDETSGQTSHKGEPIPVRMDPGGDWRNRPQGTLWLRDHDFTAKSGCCYIRDGGDPALVELSVHSNCHYTFRVLDQPQKVHFLIESEHGREFWSNADGWVDREAATRFTVEEKATYLALPGRNSRWVEVIESAPALQGVA